MSVTDVAQDANMVKNWVRWTLVLAALVAMALVTGGRAWWTDRRYKSAMEEIEADIVTGRYAIACRNLDTLLSWRTDWNGGITYLLGSCELARGRSKAAADAWARVAPGVAFSERAIRGRMRLFHDSGQFRAAEQLITDAAAEPRYDRTALRVLLVPIFREQRRIEDAEPLIEDRWQHLNASGEGALEPAIKLLLEHIDLTLNPTPVDEVRAFLERVSKIAPDDDRIWLGRANLAIQNGAYEEAKGWLDACQRRRPDDIPIWHARLKWAMATSRIDVVNEAVAHLPDLASNSTRSYQVQAWLAFHRGDTTRERQQLELLIAADPANTTALSRLAELAEDAGQPAKAAEYQRERAEIERSLARYRQLHTRKQPIRHAAELGRLARRFGRRFEAQAFLTIATTNAARRGRRAVDAGVKRP
jgi:tetratricopeptide (TPR) repeat protein